MKIINFIKNNWLFFVFFLILLVFGILYIQKTFVDVVYLDGLMWIPMLERYFNNNLTITDFTQLWGEHRLVGYSLFFLFNTIVFHLNMKLEPFVFLFSYFLIGLVLYFVYVSFLKRAFKGNFKKWMEVTYLPILFLIFSLVHPPLILMTTQFVVGTLFFVISMVFFDKLCRGSENKSDLILFMIISFIYILFLSGANFGGMVLGVVFCFLLRVFFGKKNIKSCLRATFFTLILFLGYFISIGMAQKDIGLVTKIVLFFTRFEESFLSILAGLSAMTLDIHTFEEFLSGNDIFVLINGVILFLAGIYAFYKYFFLRMYRLTYVPLLLMLYSLGLIVSTRLGRLDGGWLWTMNDWYSFHLYFYLVGVLWILFYDFLKKVKFLKRGDFKLLLLANKWGFIVFGFLFFWIFSFQALSNLVQWRRGKYVKEWMEEKKVVFLSPTDENIDSLLWNREDSLKAIKVLKDNNLSVFRQGNICFVELSGWYDDNWIGKEATSLVKSENGILTVQVYIPDNIFMDVYEKSLNMQILINEEVASEVNFVAGSFDNGPVSVHLMVPKNEIFNLKFETDKFFIPMDYNLGNDLRELGVIISNFEVK